jgi:XrtJ-associated TM-motif-TM protein
MKNLLPLFCLTLSLSAALPLHAQGGEIIGSCDDSPENPTVVLAAVGLAGAGLASARTRLKARRFSADKTNE